MKERGGDSRILFQCLAKSILGEESIKNHSVMNLFCAGDFVKETTCEQCRKSRRTIENPLIFNVMEDSYYSGKNMENFFEDWSEKRKCSECKQQTIHLKRVSFTALPEIFAVRIAEDSSKYVSIKESKIRLKLRFLNQGRLTKYEFVSGVFNTVRGPEGFHSIAYVKRNYQRRGIEEEFLVYNDETVEIVRESQINQFPKLLFYRRVTDEAF